jgi:WD40-like Beta Propeller Repeat
VRRDSQDKAPQGRGGSGLSPAVWVLIFAAVGVLLLPAGAMAARTTRLPEGSIESFSKGEPSSIAVDQSNGDVYAIDAAENTHVVYRFDSSGAPKDFTAGPDAGTNILTGFLPSSPPGQHGPSSIAIDNSGGPLDGTIYVSEGTNYTPNDIRLFARSGASLGLLDGSATHDEDEGLDGKLFVPCVAVDQSNGSVYVSTALTKTKIWRYAPTTPTVPLSDADYTVTGVSETATGCHSAVDHGVIYSIEDGAAGNRQLVRYAAGSAMDPKASPAVIDTGVTGVSVDPRTGDVYADEGYRIAVFDAGGNLLYRFGQIADVGAASVAVAVKSAPSGAATKAYVGDPVDGRVSVFGPVTQAPTYTHAEIGHFGEDGTDATTFKAQFNTTPRGLAFQQATGRLYTVAEEASAIFGFAAVGPSTFSPLGGFDPLSIPGPISEASLAVDNSGLASAGNVYLTSTSTNLVYGFSASGAALGGAFPIDPAVAPGAPEGSPSNPDGVAVDSAGNIWVSNAPSEESGLAGHILEYSSGGTFLRSIDTTALTPAHEKPRDLAFDSSDDLYAVVGNVIWKYTASSGYSTAVQVGPSQTSGIDLQAITVNPLDGHLYVAYGASNGAGAGQGAGLSWIDEYEPSGALLDQFVVGAGGSAAPQGLAVDGTSGALFVADSAQKKIRVFAPRALLPELSLSPASNFANTSVTLGGAVSTQGAALSDCHFEYVTEAAFQGTGFADLSSGGSVPCSPSAGSIPLDLASHPVSGSANGLVKNTEYRFRLAATNGQGSSVSDVAKFSTAAQPGVETVGAPVRTAATAVLNGRVNPRNATTEYRFEYGAQGPCDSNPCQSTPARQAGSGTEIELVSERVEGLQVNTTYHYRLVAENGNVDGPAVGGDMTVTTRASDAALSHGHFPGPPGSDRAYEQVSLPESGGNPVNGNSLPLVSADGSRVIYELNGGAPITESGNGFGNVIFSERPGGEHPQIGWQSRSFTPARSQIAEGPEWELETTPDLSTVLGVVKSGLEPGLAAWQLPLPGEPSELFHSTANQQRGLLQGISADGSRKLVALLGGVADPDHPSAGAAVNLYDVSSGAAKLASVLPDGNPACVGNQVTESQQMPGSEAPWISPDGSLVYFTSIGDAGTCSGPRQVFVRDLEAGQTTQLSGTPVSGPSCDAYLLRTTPTAAFFYTTSRLAPEDGAPASCSGENGDVYRYSLGDGVRDCVTCALPGIAADVMLDNPSGSFADEEIGVSSDGSRVYFQTTHHLLPGTPPDGARAIYRVDVSSGDLAYVAPVDRPVVLGHDYRDTGRYGLDADGSALTFRSAGSGLNSLGGTSNGGTVQYYRYDDRDRSLTCLSCPLDGSAPAAGVEPYNLPTSADGMTVAFPTATPLIGSDQNTPKAGTDPRVGTDIYEWRDGRLLLVTDGLTSWASRGGQFAAESPRIAAIDPSGRDIFFSAPVAYTPDALDGYRRLYDARIGGGIDFPEQPTPCPLEVCQGTPKGAPEESPPGSSDFLGAGNAVADPNSCSKARVRRHGRCAARSRKHKRARTRANHHRRTHR